MDKKEMAKYIAVAVLAAAAIALLFRNATGETRPLDWYYDLSEARLYAAPTGSIAPLAGIGGASGDGVEAVVVAPEGKCADAKARRIAYLVTYTEEYKRLKEQAARTGEPNQTADRAFQAANTLVKRVDDAEWTAATSPAGEAIVTGWMTGGEAGVRLRPCKPS